MRKEASVKKVVPKFVANGEIELIKDMNNLKARRPPQKNEKRKYREIVDRDIELGMQKKNMKDKNFKKAYHPPKSGSKQRFPSLGCMRLSSSLPPKRPSSGLKPPPCPCLLIERRNHHCQAHNISSCPMTEAVFGSKEAYPYTWATLYSLKAEAALL